MYPHNDLDREHQRPQRSRMTITIRRARIEDAASLASLAERAFRTTYSGLVDDAIIEAIVAQTCTTSSFAELVSAPEPQRLLIAEDGVALGGFLDFGQEPDGLELRRLYARTGGTGKGVGSALLKALEASLPMGASYRITVLDRNTRGLAFWQRHGFHLHGEVDGIRHFTEHRGVTFQADAGSAQLLVLNRSVGEPDGGSSQMRV